MKKISLTNIKLFVLLLTIIGVQNAYAVPSFTRQTGMSCTACHSVFPELTKVGRDFKLRGYTMGGGETIMPLPLAAMIMADSTSVSKSKEGNGDFVVVNEDGRNKNGELVIPQVSIFYGGKIYGNVGMFMQVTYDGTLLPQNKAVATRIAMDNTDIRYADSVMFGNKELIYGVSLNNNPTVQDPWNSTPAWGFPYSGSAVAPEPAAATRIDDGLGGMIAGVYQTVPGGGLFSILGWNNGGADPVVYGDAPYGRLAIQHGFGNHYIMLGGYAMTTQERPAGATTHKLDTYRDVAIDAEYQYNNENHSVTATASRTMEGANLDATQAEGGSDNSYNSLTTTRARVSYYYDHKYGASLGYSSTYGTADASLYGTSATLKPDTDYSFAELMYLPVKQVKFSLKYTMYSKFDGAATNYDGNGRDASDNNTLHLIGWFMF